MSIWIDRIEVIGECVIGAALLTVVALAAMARWAEWKMRDRKGKGL